MICEDRRDDIFLFAAESLEGREREELSSHLDSGCEICQGELRQAQEILTDVSFSLDPVKPPPQSKARLLARVLGEEDEPSVGALSRMQASIRPSLWRGALAAGIASVAAAGLTAALVTRPSAPSVEELLELKKASVSLSAERDALLLANEDLRTERDELQEFLDEQDEELSDLENSLSISSVALEMLRQPNIDRAQLSGTKLQPHATGTVFWEWEAYNCYFYAENLKSLAADRTYAIWLFEADGAPVFIGTFTPDDRGRANFFQTLPDAELNPVRLAVTDEPYDVVEPESPTGAVHLEAVVARRDRLELSG